MTKYIAREEVKRIICEICGECDGDVDVCEFRDIKVDAITAADVRHVVRGKWTMNSDFPDRLICSECGAQFDVWHWEAKQMHFCPNCGAMMEES